MCALRVSFLVRGVMGYVVGMGGLVEGGDDLSQYCYVEYVFRIISNTVLFVSVKVSFITEELFQGNGGSSLENRKLMTVGESLR
jgi:hypothetical protein